MSVAADVIVSADVDAATDDTFDEGPQLLERLGGGIGMLFFFFLARTLVVYTSPLGGNLLLLTFFFFPFSFFGGVQSMSVRK